MLRHSCYVIVDDNETTASSAHTHTHTISSAEHDSIERIVLL